MDTETIKRELRMGKRAFAAARELSMKAIGEKLEIPKGTVSDIIYDKNQGHADKRLVKALYEDQRKDAELAKRYTIRAISERHGINRHAVKRIAQKVHAEMLEKGEL